MNDSVLTRFWTIIFNPSAAMAAVREKPRVLVAALAVILMMGFFTAATLHIAGPEQVDVMRDTRIGRMMPPEDIDKMYDDYLNLTTVDRVKQALPSGFGGAATVFVLGLVFLLFGKLAGGQGTFGQVMGVVFWSNVVSLGYASLIKWPLVLAKGSMMQVSLGPAVLVSGRGVLDPLFGLLSMFDVFTIWGVVLIVIGFEKVHGFARNKAVVAVVATWLLVSLVMFGIGRLFI
ncbi:YIP1 family protein [bacterium]|nr:YIP1 family protein [bacterium]MBU1071924.1 YIP1 family protein [bacterium]MBU1676508.1 YIP1 family protein [bacterium]